MNPIIQEDIQNILSKDLPWDKLQGERILITGATGMLASYLVYTVCAWMKKHPDSNTELVLAVRNPEKTRERFENLLKIKNVSVVIWNGTDDFDYAEQITYIIHAASIADSSMFMKIPVETIEPNVIGTWKLLQLAYKHHTKGFLFFSTGSVYGKVSNCATISETDMGYLLPQDVRSCYGESKRMGENLCACFAHEYQVPAYAVRISHTYGPTMDLKNDTRVFADFVRNILKNENITMKSDGAAKRAFCYIADATEAFFRILFGGEPGQVYNMCNSDQFVSIAELAQMMVELFPERNLQVIRQVRSITDSYSENKHANTDVLSNLKLKTLGWNPEIGISEGFRRTIESFEKRGRD